MPIQVPLRVIIESDGATWTFRPPDKAMSRLAARAGGIGEFDTDSPPEEIIEVMPDMFVEGVVAWEVEDMDGNPLECNEENRRDIPTTMKLRVVTAYLLKIQEIELKKGE